MKPKDILWCGEGDLNSRSPLKTRKLYRTQRAENTRSARSTPPSHTTSHTACGGKRRICCKFLCVRRLAPTARFLWSGLATVPRSEERRVGKECRSRGSA